MTAIICCCRRQRIQGAAVEIGRLLLVDAFPVWLLVRTAKGFPKDQGLSCRHFPPRLPCERARTNEQLEVAVIFFVQFALGRLLVGFISETIGCIGKVVLAVEQFEVLLALSKINLGLKLSIFQFELLHVGRRNVRRGLWAASCPCDRRCSLVGLSSV